MLYWAQILVHKLLPTSTYPPDILWREGANSPSFGSLTGGRGDLREHMVEDLIRQVIKCLV